MEQSILSLSPLPSNHRIVLQDESNDKLAIFLKRRIPVRSLLNPWLLGAAIAFVLGVAALLMYQYEPDFMLLSVPFWIISFILLALFVNQLFERQWVYFTRSQVTICKERFFASQKLLLQRNSNYDISLLADRKSEAENALSEKRVPVIFFRLEAFSFFEHASIDEKYWIIKALRDFQR